MKNETEQNRNRSRRIAGPVIFAIVILLAIFFVYTERYYRADSEALASMQGSDDTAVYQAALGYLFDGPGEEDLLIFYPGAKVEETAYAPMLHRLADQGMDVYLVHMPARLAFFGIERASEVFTEKLVDPNDITVWTPARERYAHFYIGGHSLGGAMAANYAAKHPDKIEGLVLLAAYAADPLPEDLSVLSVYGSEDGVLNREKYEENKANLPADYQEIELTGGNHAQFGSYGLQKSDGTASISPEEQWERTIQAVLEWK